MTDDAATGADATEELTEDALKRAAAEDHRRIRALERAVEFARETLLAWDTDDADDVPTDTVCKVLDKLDELADGVGDAETWDRDAAIVYARAMVWEAYHELRAPGAEKINGAERSELFRACRAVLAFDREKRCAGCGLTKGEHVGTRKLCPDAATNAATWQDPDDPALLTNILADDGDDNGNQ